MASAFRLGGTYCGGAPYGNGHINDTFAVSFEQGGVTTRYILQRINENVFRQVDAVMENVARVTAHAGRRAVASGAPDAIRRALTLIPTRSGGNLHRDAMGAWRCYIFIEGATSHDLIEHPAMAREAARAFGEFQRLLSDLPGGRLLETIPDFHHTPKRLEALRRAIAADSRGRVREAGPEIAFVLERAGMVGTLLDLQARGKMPERVTHNDTKINNVLIDDQTGAGICVIDLDTVMPGLALYDFGDMVRSATNSAAEDEPDVAKVKARLDIFDALVEGYLGATRSILTEAEIDHLAFSGRLITLEIGIRFLTDYLEGDTYFKVHRPGHNLERARTQFALVRSMEEQQQEMEAIVRRHASRPAAIAARHPHQPAIPTSVESQQRERIPTEIFDTADDACRRLAGEIATLIRTNTAAGRNTVLGLATGSTPVRLYKQLIRLHRTEGLSFSRVLTFNLDEYYGLSREHPESYWRFMHEQLFNHIDIPAENIHVPDGTVARSDVFAWCRAYEEKIRAAGGLDLQVLGIGRTGHIGFNEPGSSRESRTRLVTLDGLTRRDAARDFLGEANVPRHAITMGVGTILDARRIVLLAWGESKAGVIAEAVEGTPTDSLPASFLQGHPQVRFLIDRAAAAALTRVRHPWLVTPIEWTPIVTRRAVMWLAKTVKKPVLKLLDEDYSEHGMADLLTEHGPSYGLNIRIFNEIQHTITGWPGGKPNADDSFRPERAFPFPKRVVVFSPEPSHDVLGMGGTLRRLKDQGHGVTVVYLTSGNLAVPDEEAVMAADLVGEIAETLARSQGPVADFARTARRELLEKSAFAGDSVSIRRLKGLLRRGEARASLRDCGYTAEQARFLDLAFYERGRYRQFVPDDADVAAVASVLREYTPNQIFLTGDRDDPSSIPAVCYDIVRRACRLVAEESWFRECRAWVYRGVEHPWEAADIDMAVPLSPRELAQKVQAVFHHKSQRSQTPVAAGLREPWQQSEQQNRALAATYDELGLADYEALEGFARARLE
ncbi:MAG: glucosamine-6-phosphate deaminase [Verrucomicrobia bacterium]|nr:glucosamine-6-phosphate deaminase [Verrucomicrobiota bacterium]